MRGLNVSAIQMLMILVMSSVLSGTALSIREFIKERDIYERERMVGLSATAYLLSKVLVLSVISVLQSLLVVLVGLLGREDAVERGGDPRPGDHRDLRRARRALGDVHAASAWRSPRW